MRDFGIERRPSSSRCNSRTDPTRRPTIHTDAYGHRTFIHKYDWEQNWLTLHRLHATLLVDDISELAGKEVHHKNGCPFDNRLENYEITTKANHQRKHHFNLPPYKSLCTTCDTPSYFFDSAIVTYCPSCGAALDSNEVLETQTIDWNIDH